MLRLFNRVHEAAVTLVEHICCCFVIYLIEFLLLALIWQFRSAEIGHVELHDPRALASAVGAKISDVHFAASIFIYLVNVLRLPQNDKFLLLIVL